MKHQIIYHKRKKEREKRKENERKKITHIDTIVKKEKKNLNNCFEKAATITLLQIKRIQHQATKTIQQLKHTTERQERRKKVVTTKIVNKIKI